MSKSLNIAIIVWNQDLAGMNIKSQLDKLLSTLSNANIKAKIHTINKRHIQADLLDKEIDADLFIFTTTHRSEANKKTLCVHPIGIYSDDISLGGKAHTLVPTSPWLIRGIFLEMNKLKPNYQSLQGFDISVEQTHHGPFLEKPALFVEIGSTEAEWTNKDAGELIAKAVFNVLSKFDYSERNIAACILGGGHYNQIANKILTKTELCIGHICSKYALEYLDEAMVRQMKEKTDAHNPVLFIFDWKSCGAEKQRIIDILNRLGYEWKKSKELLKSEDYSKSP